MTADLSALIARLEAAEAKDSWVHAPDVHLALFGSSLSKAAKCPPFTTSLDAALALAERVYGEASALDLLQDVLSRHDSSGISIRDLPRLLCSFIFRAKQGEGE